MKCFNFITVSETILINYNDFATKKQLFLSLFEPLKQPLLKPISVALISISSKFFKLEKHWSTVSLIMNDLSKSQPVKHSSLRTILLP